MHSRFFAFSALICLGLLCRLSSASAREPSFASNNWVALQAGGEIVTAREVREYIDAVVLSSDVHAAIFRQANGDYSAYLAEKDALVEDLFEVTLDRMALTRVIQVHALRDAERRAFLITRKQMADAVAAQVASLLAPYLRRGMGEAEAKAALVESLKAEGMPHEPGEASEQIYQGWRRRLNLRLREEYRQREAARFLCRLGDCDRDSFLEIFRRNRAAIERSNFLLIRGTPGDLVRRERAYDRLAALGSVPLETPGPAEEVSKRVTDLYIGRIISDRVELLHINDWNLLGPVGTRLGYPATDDYGRTSGVILSRTWSGTRGDLTIRLENWLFAERLAKTPDGTVQNVEEETTIRIASRQFLDEEGNQWLVLGVSGTDRSQRAGIGSWLQENFHKLNSGHSPRINVSRDGGEDFLQGLFGVGGRYSLIESSHVDLVLSGEGVLAPTLGDLSQNSVNVRTAIDVNVYGKTRQLPVFQLGAFSEFRMRASGQLETALGARATVALLLRSFQLEAGLFVVRWDGELDRRYEGGPSWTTGLMISVTKLAPVPATDYEF